MPPSSKEDSFKEKLASSLNENVGVKSNGVTLKIIPSSSTVEQTPVKGKATGSKPVLGAISEYGV
jgi:hypothetical protein